MPDGKNKESNQISLGRMLNSILFRQTYTWQARETYGTYGRTGLHRKEQGKNPFFFGFPYNTENTGFSWREKASNRFVIW